MTCIVCPTLKLSDGERAVKDAAATSGLASVSTHVTLDTWGTGGCKPANVALQAGLDSGASYICYINDDVWFPEKGWMAQLIKALEEDVLFAAAGPTGKCGEMPQKEGVKSTYPITQVVHRLSFFCVVFKRSTLEQVGLLDEGFHHWGCDSDYCERIRQAGLKSVWARHVWVDHRSPLFQARPTHIKAWKDQDAALFRRKWEG